MNLKIIPTPEFTKSVKKLFKKYRLIYKDLEVLERDLSINQKFGIDLGNNCFKIRLQNSSIPVGKRGGFRVIYYYIDLQNRIYLLDIFSKTELENIRDNALIEIMKRNGLA